MNKDFRYVKPINPVKSIKFYQPNKTLKPIKPISISNFTREIYQVRIIESNKKIFSEIKKRIKEKQKDKVTELKDEIEKFKKRTNLNKFITTPIKLEEIKITLPEEKKEETKDLKDLEEIIKEVPPIQFEEELISLPEEGYYLLLKYGNFDLDMIISTIIGKYNFKIDEKNIGKVKQTFDNFIKNKKSFVQTIGDVLEVGSSVYDTAYEIAYHISQNKSYKFVTQLAKEIFNILKVIKTKQIMLDIKELVLNRKHPYFKDFVYQSAIDSLRGYADLLNSDAVEKITKEFESISNELSFLSQIDFRKLKKGIFDNIMFDFLSKISFSQLTNNLLKTIGFSGLPNFVSIVFSLINLISNLSKYKKLKKAFYSDLYIIDSNGKYLTSDEALNEVKKIAPLFENFEQAKFAYDIISFGHYLQELIELINAFKVYRSLLFLEDFSKFYEIYKDIKLLQPEPKKIQEPIETPKQKVVEKKEEKPISVIEGVLGINKKENKKEDKKEKEQKKLQGLISSALRLKK